MRNKKFLLPVIFSILVMFSLASCKSPVSVNIVNDNTEGETVSKATDREEKDEDDVKKHEKKNRDNKKLINTSGKPHILLKDTMELHNDDESSTTLYRIKYVYLQLKEDGKEFEPLKRSFENYNKDLLDKLSKTREAFDSFAKEQLSDIQQGYESKELFSETDSYIMRADKYAVSILNYTKYNYGASDKYSRESINFDTDTGKKLEFLDVVKDDKSFFEMADKRVYEDYEEINIQKPSEYAYTSKKNNYENLVWTVSPVGVTVYFDSGVLGAETDGPQVITISFDENETIFEPKYVYKENEYVIPVVAGNMTIHVDTDGDGVRDSVFVDDLYEQNPETLDIYNTGMKVCAGTQSTEIECYEGKAYLVKMDGNYYMYMFVQDEIRLLYCLDLKYLNSEDRSDKYFYLGTREGTWDQKGEIENYVSIEETFTDTESFIGEYFGDLGILFPIEKEWFVGEDGTPQSSDDKGRVTSGIAFRTLKDIKCTEVDKEGKVKKSDTKIVKGTLILPLYANDKEYMDVITVDEDDLNIWNGAGEEFFSLTNMKLLDYEGDFYRITFENDDGDLSIDGTDIFDLFEGIITAG